MSERSGLQARGQKGDDPEAFTHTVGAAIRRTRQERGWTQNELAEAAGLSTNYVARLERGEVGPSLFVAQKLCEALEIDLDSLTAAPRAARIRSGARAR